MREYELPASHIRWLRKHCEYRESIKNVHFLLNLSRAVNPTMRPTPHEHFAIVQLLYARLQENTFATFGQRRDVTSKDYANYYGSKAVNICVMK